MNPATSKPEQSRPPPANLLTLELLKETAPELAIKIAYDFARNLRTTGADEGEFPGLLKTHVDDHFTGSTLLPYIRWGFAAGFHFLPLPWRREIERGGGPIEDLLYNTQI